MSILQTVTSLDLPDVGDLTKDLAMECGLDETWANRAALGSCVLSGDLYGSFEHGLDVAEDSGMQLDGSVRVDARRDTYGCYPAPDDVEGWQTWIEENGYEAFVQAYKEGAVDGSVLKDPGFMLVMQDEKAKYEAYYAFASNLLASEDKLRQLIISNMRG